jgi:dihydrolipoamide dehydrogenase
MSIEKADIVVIGGGAGGVPAAIRARQLGAEVVLVERDRIGGTCMNRGCIPMKTLLETARLYQAVKQGDRFGIKTESAVIDWVSLMDKKAQTIEYLRLGTESVLKSNGVSIVRGEAAFIGPNTVKIGQREITARAFIVGTGAEYAALGVAGIESEGVITPDEVLSMTEVPARVVVLGGGPVELELAQYLNYLGSSVTLLLEGKRILDEDWYGELSGRLVKELKSQGLNILTNTEVGRIVPGDGGLSVEYETKEGRESMTADRVLHANRVPALQGLNLEAAGLNLPNYSPKVDNRLRIDAHHIYAIGDCSGGPLYSHRAAAMGITAAENALGLDKVYDETALIRGVTTSPEAAAVGLTEKQARKAGYEVTIGLIPYAVNAMGMIRLDTKGMVKIVAEAKYGQVLGVHIIGPGAMELISEGALALETEVTLDELAESKRYHPSFSESLADAAREALGRGIYVMR